MSSPNLESLTNELFKLGAHFKEVVVVVVVDPFIFVFC